MVFINWLLGLFRYLVELHGGGSPFAYQIAHNITWLWGDNVPDTFVKSPFMIDFAKGMIAMLVIAAAKVIWDNLLEYVGKPILAKIFVMLKYAPPSKLSETAEILLKLVKLLPNTLITLIAFMVGDTLGDFFVDTLYEFLGNLFPNASQSTIVLCSFIGIFIITSILLQVLTYLSDRIQMRYYKFYPMSTICCQMLVNMVPALIELFTVDVFWIGLCLSIYNNEHPAVIFGAIHCLFFVTLGMNYINDYIQAVIGWYYLFRYTPAKMIVNIFNILEEVPLFATFLIVLTFYSYNIGEVSAEMQQILDNIPLVSIIYSDLSFTTLTTINYDFALFEFLKAFLMFLITASILRLYYKIPLFKTVATFPINFFVWMFGAPAFVLGCVVAGSISWLIISSMTFTWAGITCLIILVAYCIICPALLLHAFIDSILIFTMTGFFINVYTTLASSQNFDAFVIPIVIIVCSTLVFKMIRCLAGVIAAPFDWTI